MFYSRYIAVAALWFLASVTAQAQVPEALNYQGYLTDAAGQAIDEPVNVVFALYAVPTGGSPLWIESKSLVPSKGLFSTELGVGLSPFPLGLFDTPLWMGLSVGNDAEMTPRRVLATAPYAKHALDADVASDAVRLGGQLPSNFADSAQVSALAGDVALQDGQIATNAGAILSVEGDVAAVNADVSQLQSEINTNASDIQGIESTLPGLQERVSGSCSSGSSIRQVFSNGTVSCETDDGGTWSLGSANAAYYVDGNVGVGTTAPVAAVQIDAPADVDPFRARVQSSTKLRVHVNGSVSIGTSAAGPENGAYVAGNMGVGTNSPTARGTLADVNWQLSLDNTDAGGDDWYVGSSATAWAAGAGKFIISPVANSNSAPFVIDATGDLGLGTTDPQSRLHIGSGTDVNPISGGFITLGSLTGTNIGIDNNEIMARSNGAVTTLSLNAEGGEVRINSAGARSDDALEVRGIAYFDNGGNGGMRITATDSSPTNALFESTQYEEGLLGWVGRPFWRMYSREFYAASPIEYRTYSDRSLKSNVQTIDNALDIIKAIDGVSYSLSKQPMDPGTKALSEKEQYDNDHQLGFIAQDLEKVLPQLVKVDETSGLATVGYMGLIPVLVEALKDQQRQIDELKDELAQR